MGPNHAMVAANKLWPNQDPLGEAGFGNSTQNTKSLGRSTDP